jgi:hypothetical protein
MLITNQQYLLKNRLDGIGVTAHKGSNAGVVRDRVARQRLKNNIVLTLPLNLAAGRNALGVGEQYYFQENSWVVCGAATAIIVVFIVKGRKIDVAINEPMQCELERIGFQLLFEVYNQHCGLVIPVLLEIWHLGIHISMPYFIKKTPIFWSFSTVSTPR